MTVASPELPVPLTAAAPSRAARTRPRPAPAPDPALTLTAAPGTAVSVTAVPGTAVPALRLLPAPASEPPYDDELPTALQPAPSAPLRLAPAAAPLRLVPPLTGDDEEWSRPRTPLGQLPPAQPFVHAFVQRLLEVLAGVRPVSQFRRDTTPELYAHLEQHLAARPRTGGTRPEARAVRSVHVQTQPQGVAEACATVKRQTPQGPRAVALALRLEGLEGRWCCTEVVGLSSLAQQTAPTPSREPAPSSRGV